MFVVKSKVRAFAVALLPLLFLHCIFGVLGLLGHVRPGDTSALPSPDDVLALLTRRLALDAWLILVGHLCLRRLRLGGRGAYALMGGLAGVISYAIALNTGMTYASPVPGAVVTAGLLPLVAGMIAGLVYNHVAGREFVAPAAGTEVVPAGVPYQGPVQVRTSFGAVGIAAIVPSAALSMFIFLFTYNSTSGLGIGDPVKFNWSHQILALSLPAQMFVQALLVTAVPGALFVTCTHVLARALRWTRGLHYAAIGAGLAMLFVGAITLFNGFVLFVVPSAIVGALMGAVYRRYAGLEPLSLPEAVLVAEPETLVGADHPSRKGHLVLNP